MIFTPEMSGLLDRNRARSATQIQPEAQDIVLEAVQGAAKESGIWVALGSLAIKHDDETGKRANRSYVIDDTGQIRARYDKIHLFDVDLPNGESWRESSAYEPGARAVVQASPIGTLGLSICYDMRFPQLYQSLSGAGAQILAIPAAFTVPTGKAHWHILLRSRAIENGCWVVASAQTGVHEDGRSTYGHSLVISPWGDIILDMEVDAGIGYADIDLSLVADVRARIPVLDHRRTFDAAETCA